MKASSQRSLSDTKLDTIRARAEAAKPPGQDAEYSDASWEAALALMGLAPMTPDR
jgi:hypothetical protein